MAVLEEAVLCAFQQCVYYVSKVRPRPMRGGAAGSSRSLQRGGGHLGKLGGPRAFPAGHPTPAPVPLSWLAVTVSHEPSGPDWGASGVGEAWGGRPGESHVAGGMAAWRCRAAVAAALR